MMDQQQVLTQYDVIGEAYVSSQENFYKFHAPDQARVRILKALPASVEAALDLGCGSGKDLLVLRERYPSARLFGVDPSQLMCEKARLLNHEAIVSVGTSEATGLESNSLDLVTSRFAIHYNQCLDQTWAEIARVLRPGGICVLAVPHPFRSLVLSKEGTYGMQELLPVELYEGSVVVHFPSHTLSEYFSPTFFSHFNLSQLEEYDEQEPAERGLHVPSVLFLVAQKHTS